MQSLVIPYQSYIRDAKYTLPLKRKELSCADFGRRFWQSPVDALCRKSVLWERPAGKRFWPLRAGPANLRKFVRLQFHRRAYRTKHVQFKFIETFTHLPFLGFRHNIHAPIRWRWRKRQSWNGSHGQGQFVVECGGLEITRPEIPQSFGDSGNRGMPLMVMGNLGRV